MTQKRYNEIPKRQKCVNKEEPYIGGTEDIVDDTLGKPQSEVNQDRIEDITAEVQRAQGAESTLDGKIGAEKTRAESVEGGLNTRLQTVEELAEISVGGGNIGIGTAADFESDDPEDLAKVPTVGAILGGANDGVYDISARHNGTKYADLAAALGTNGINVPVGARKGGMSVKFVQSSDNKYVQYRCVADEFSTNTEDWAIADEGVYVENPEFVYVRTDKDDKIIWAIKTDGGIYYGAGVPQQIIDYIEEKLAGFSPDEYEDIVTFLNDYLGSDTTLKTLIDSKLDAEGLDADALKNVHAVENPEYIQVATDNENKILEGITSKGVKQINLPIDTPSVTIEHVENPEWMKVDTDNEGKILEGFKKNGEKVVYVDTKYPNGIPSEIKEYVENAIISASVNITNPYEGMDFSRTTLAQSHEHCFDESKVQSAYNRGIRVIACSHYGPSIPRYPLSDFNCDYKDYKSIEAVNNGDTELITRHYSDIAQIDHIPTSIPFITVDGETINTDTIPQIANAEHPLVRDFGGHCNILGLLWGEPGWYLAGDVISTPETRSWKNSHRLVTPQKFNSLLEDESNWQFGSKYAFGTINHNESKAAIKTLIDACPRIFKAMEIFNQGYGVGLNRLYKDAYDEILRDGYKIWATSVVDWQGDWATWGTLLPAEQAEWEGKYNALPPVEKAEYDDARDYYMQTGRYKFDRGANMILVPSNYDTLPPELKAKEVIKAYIGGRYYLVGLGNYTLNIIRNGDDIVFRLSDICPSIRIVNGIEDKTYTNIDTIHYKAQKGDMYVRLEADWDDGDFVYSNPIWIE